MKITFQKTETIEVDVQLPAYRRSTYHWFKIDENETITVYNGGKDFRIEKVERLVEYPLGFNESNYDEFIAAYNEVKAKF